MSKRVHLRRRSSRWATRVAGHLYPGLLGVFLLLVFPLPAGAVIYDGAPAINALGQYDEDPLTNPGPIYTKSQPHDAPNRLGFYFPRMIVIDDANHRLFVADTINNRVLLYDLNANNTLKDRIPDAVLGQENFYRNETATTQAGMDTPTGLAYDGTNQRLFVADRENSRVTVFDVSTITNGENAVSVLGQPNFTSNTSATTQAGMDQPWGLAHDGVNQRLFVADTFNSRVLIFDVTEITNGENAINVLGQPNFTSNTSATTQAGMNFPQGLAYDGTNQRLFVADTSNHRVTVFDVATITNGENALDALGQTDGDLEAPAPVYTKGQPHDAPNRLGLFYPQGGVLETAGAGAFDVIIDHRLFISDTFNHRVLVYDLNDDDTLKDRVPDAVLGQRTFAARAPDTLASASGMYYPMGLAYDTHYYRLFVADQGNNRVLVFNLAPPGGITNGMSARYILGQVRVGLRGSGTSQSRMNAPRALVFDRGPDRLFVADQGNNRVLMFSLAAGIRTGMPASTVLGQPNFTSNTPATTQTGMNSPSSLAYDNENVRLFVADLNNNRVLVFNGFSSGLPASAVLGQTGFTTNTPATTQAGLRTPNGLAYDDADQRLFVSDANNNRVLVFEVAQIINGENAVNVLGQAVFTTGGSASGPARMFLPGDLVYDATNFLLFVNDQRNSRITVYDAAPANRAPISEAAISVNGGTPASVVDVFQGEPVTVRLFTDEDVTSDGLASRDPNGWTHAQFGVSNGGSCEWNSDLNQGAPTFEQTITDPLTPSSCNINLGQLTFNDPPGTYTYQVLRITDRQGARSLVASVSVRVGVRPDLVTIPAAGQPLYRSIAGPFAGDVLTFSFQVQNVPNPAGMTAGASTARVCMDDQCYQDPAANVVSTHQAPSLANGDSTGTISSGTWVATAGSHTVTLCADIPGQVGVVPERSETNNCASETFVVAGTVDLAVTDITITPSRPLPGTPVNVDAIVQNVGGVASLASSARLDIDRDGDGVFETLISPDQPVPALAPQATSSVSWLNATDAAAGPMIVRVCVDPDNQNPNETNEANCATKDTGRPPFRPGRFREVPS